MITDIKRWKWKYYAFSIKISSIICNKRVSNDYKIFKEKELIEILKNLGLGIHWRHWTILKTSKKVYEVIGNVFDTLKYVYSGSVFNTLSIQIK